MLTLMVKSKSNEITELHIERYNKKIEQHGIGDIKALGWGSREQQIFRFEKALESLDPTNKSVLDIGCGAGDFYSFLQNNSRITNYTGWEINQNFLNEAQSRFPSCKFDPVDISQINSNQEHAQYGYMMGLLNFKLDLHNNLAYSETLIRNAFSAVKEALLVDFISINRDLSYPIEPFIFYHDPRSVVHIASKISTNFVLRHNYAPIPQKEFNLVIYK